NFFKLGGNSILAIKLISSVNKENMYLKVADIYVYNTIALLAKRIFETKEEYRIIVKLNNL
ncbi:MAG: phosphopantetheine-binding protein, partial [Alphaproteobacteria bacterium]